MPHAIREEHLEDICNSCKQPHGNNFVLERHEGKIYKIITCQNCGYEIIKQKHDDIFTDKWDMFHKI